IGVKPVEDVGDVDLHRVGALALHLGDLVQDVFDGRTLALHLFSDVLAGHSLHHEDIRLTEAVGIGHHARQDEAAPLVELVGVPPIQATSVPSMNAPRTKRSDERISLTSRRASCMVGQASGAISAKPSTRRRAASSSKDTAISVMSIRTPNEN